MTYHILSHVFLHMYSPQFIRSLWITCALANPPPYSFSSLVSYKSISKRVTKMTKIPLGISKNSKLLYNSFFIISKLIALGIIGIGQVIKKTISKIPSVRGTRLVSNDMGRVRAPAQLFLSKSCNFPTFYPSLRTLLSIYQHSCIYSCLWTSFTLSKHLNHQKFN